MSLEEQQDDDGRESIISNGKESVTSNGSASTTATNNSTQPPLAKKFKRTK